MDPQLKKIAAGTLSFVKASGRISRRITDSLGVDHRAGAIISSIVLLFALALAVSLLLMLVIGVLAPALVLFGLGGMLWGGGVAIRNYIAAFRSSVSP